MTDAAPAAVLQRDPQPFLALPAALHSAGLTLKCSSGRGNFVGGGVVTVVVVVVVVVVAVVVVVLVMVAVARGKRSLPGTLRY